MFRLQNHKCHHQIVKWISLFEKPQRAQNPVQRIKMYKKTISSIDRTMRKGKGGEKIILCWNRKWIQMKSYEYNVKECLLQHKPIISQSIEHRTLNIGKHRALILYGMKRWVGIFQRNSVSNILIDLWANPWWAKVYCRQRSAWYDLMWYGV